MIYQTPLSNVVEDANAWELQIESHPSVSSKFKRLLDIIGSVVGLTILAILFVPIAIAIKLDSPGAIFYTQERYGLHGRPFMLRKFRSMVAEADKLKNWTYLLTQFPHLPDWGEAAQTALEHFFPQIVVSLLLLDIKRLIHLARSCGFDINISRCKI